MQTSSITGVIGGYICLNRELSDVPSAKIASVRDDECGSWSYDKALFEDV